MITGWKTCDYERLLIFQNRPAEVVSGTQRLRHTEYAYYFNTPFAQMGLWVGQDDPPTVMCAGYSTAFPSSCLLF